jgi:predicted dehydrogenase
MSHSILSSSTLRKRPTLSNYDNQLKIAVLGCGNWGKNHIRVLHELGVLHSISDPNKAQAEHYATLYQIPILSLEAILANPSVQGVVIATPAQIHFELAKRCLEAGKSILVEKPITLTLDDAQQLQTLAQKQGACLMVGHLLHHHAAFIKIKELKAQGALGKLQAIYSNRLNLGKFETEKDIWWSYAPHDVSMILSLVDSMPLEVMAREANYLKHTQSDITHAHLSFPEGEQAHIFVSWLHPYKEQKLTVIGDKAMLIFDDSQPWESKLQLYPYPEEWVDGLPKPCQSQTQAIPLPPSEPLKRQAEHFLECITHKTTPIADGQEAIRVLEVLLAAKHSIHSTAINLGKN